MNTSKADTKQLLQRYYNLTTEELPEQRIKSEWKSENKLGFLQGVVELGQDNHRIRLQEDLASNKFEEETFIESMFQHYIQPFHKSFSSEAECRTPDGSSRASSRKNSEKDLDYVLKEKEFNHLDMKNAVVERDRVCLFCWDILECEGAHIISQKNISMPYDELSLLHQAGLTQLHQVQNGLLLCNKCHSQFDKLKRYVDVIDDKLVVKVVNGTNDETSEKYREWIIINNGLLVMRRISQNRWTDNRLAEEANGEMALYFVDNDETKLPNREALKFHKTACLIWRMAGGAEPDEEYCSDDDDLGPVDTATLKRRFKIQDSAETLDLATE
jgi:hypothetical protein